MMSLEKLGGNEIGRTKSFSKKGDPLDETGYKEPGGFEKRGRHSYQKEAPDRKI